MAGQPGDHTLHPAVRQILRHFEYKHLPPDLADVSMEANRLAWSMARLIRTGPELTAGLRKLLEAKDCFVRAAIDSQRSDE
jgi:hypothetical protein